MISVRLDIFGLDQPESSSFLGHLTAMGLVCQPIHETGTCLFEGIIPTSMLPFLELLLSTQENKYQLRAESLPNASTAQEIRRVEGKLQRLALKKGIVFDDQVGILASEKERTKGSRLLEEEKRAVMDDRSGPRPIPRFRVLLSKLGEDGRQVMDYIAAGFPHILLTDEFVDNSNMGIVKPGLYELLIEEVV